MTCPHPACIEGLCPQCSGEPRSLGGELPITRRCWRGEHKTCTKYWTAYPDQGGPCECDCHKLPESAVAS